MGKHTQMIELLKTHPVFGFFCLIAFLYLMAFILCLCDCAKDKDEDS